MIIIGLTGGIGAGKSTVSRYLVSKNFGLCDADLIAHQITEKGEPALQELSEAFGDGIIREDGTLDRKGLANIVFRDEDKRAILNEITHRHINRVIDEQIDAYKRENTVRGIIIDAILLFETRLCGLTDENWVVTADEEIRIKRTMARDNTSEELVRDRIRSQTKDAERLAKADRVLDNSGTEEMLHEQIDKILAEIE